MTNHEYDEQKFQELVQTADTNRILHDVSHDIEQAKLIGNRFTNALARELRTVGRGQAVQQDKSPGLDGLPAEF